MRASVWLAMAGWLAGVMHAIDPTPDGSARMRGARLLWSIGFAVYVAHVLSAFHVFYEWSHAVALQETARQTAAATGTETGAGLWLNHLFTLLWGADVAWWWFDPASHRKRSGWITAVLHGFLYFMVFNGSVVFGSGPVRAFGAVVCALPALALVRRWIGGRR